MQPDISVREAVEGFVDCYYDYKRLHRDSTSRERIIQAKMALIEAGHACVISRDESNIPNAVKLTLSNDGLFEAKPL